MLDSDASRAAKNLKPYQGLKLRFGRQRTVRLALAAKNLKPYQGLKLTLSLQRKFDKSSCRKKPKTLSGIETNFSFVNLTTSLIKPQKT